ncbi:MAG: hypothetical protein UR89_C0016G0003 [Candidatus Roizmanbacteria bacterium GW2011_GWA2_35_8]|uniref:Uncharacterized protein n=1 Tax=Candidatus Roizmanbacteria bacterium GW2011_GWA2_35_8 TaxID=1618479 RepID=A0A0G0CXH5_9BACT|nr:MAG: hypothetical protein UR89_C0016G0003 [Candidatus Roizmanbacteria bacterium GW2011_GWA2_35_8]
MKKDDFCFNKNIFYLLVIGILLFLFIKLVSFANKEKYAYSSKAQTASKILLNTALTITCSDFGSENNIVSYCMPSVLGCGFVPNQTPIILGEGVVKYNKQLVTCPNDGKCCVPMNYLTPSPTPLPIIRLTQNSYNCSEGKMIDAMKEKDLSARIQIHFKLVNDYNRRNVALQQGKSKEAVAKMTSGELYKYNSLAIVNRINNDSQVYDVYINSKISKNLTLKTILCPGAACEESKGTYQWDGLRYCYKQFGKIVVLNRSNGPGWDKYYIICGNAVVDSSQCNH